MSLALGVLRWPPDSFWRASPRELAAAAAGLRPVAAAPPSAADLRRLMAAFPDATMTETDHGRNDPDG